MERSSAMRRRLADFALVGCATLLGGCTLLLDLDDARTRATPPPTTADGSIADAFDEPDSPLDAADISDVATSDAADTSDVGDAPDEGATDGSGDADALVSRCTGSTADLCLDFESGTLAALPLAVLRTTSTETVEFTPMAKQGARALRSHHAGGSSPGERVAHVVKQFPSWKTIDVELDAKVSVSGPVTSTIELMGILFLPSNSGGQFVYVALYLTPSGVDLYTQTTGGTENSKAVGGLSAGWNQIRMKALPPASGGTGAGSVELTLNGVTTTAALAFDHTPQADAFTKIQVGVRRFAGTAPEVEMLIDDLLMDR
jgi:hypothetical protein